MGTKTTSARSAPPHEWSASMRVETSVTANTKTRSKNSSAQLTRFSTGSAGVSTASVTTPAWPPGHRAPPGYRTGRAGRRDARLPAVPAPALGPPVPREDVAAYLRRLGAEAEPPSVDGLRRLHRAHVERAPYETFWIHLEQAWGIEPEASLSRIARDGRGGYCFQLNGSLSLLLDALGYRVTRHVGGVHGPDGPSVEALTNHLVLVVHGLPDEESPDGR